MSLWLQPVDLDRPICRCERRCNRNTESTS